jgi:hypothetical protein
MHKSNFVVFDPEASDECLTYSDDWKTEWEEAYDEGHIEIVDAGVDPPRRYAGNGNWIKLERA